MKEETKSKTIKTKSPNNTNKSTNNIKSKTIKKKNSKPKSKDKDGRLNPKQRKDSKNISLMKLAKERSYIVDNETIFNLLKPYLLLGVSLHRACSQALIPYSTAQQRYKDDVNFQNMVDNATNNISFIARAKLAQRVKDTVYHEKDVKYWLDNVDSDIKKSNVSGVKVQSGDITVSIVSYDN